MSSTVLSLILSLVVSFNVFAASPEINFLEEKSISFPLNTAAMSAQKVQVAVEFIPVSGLSKINPAILKSDSLQQIQKAAQSWQLPNSATNKQIRTIVLMRSAHIVNAPVEKILGMQLQNITNLESLFSFKNLQPGCENKCNVLQTVNFIFNADITANLETAIYDLGKAPEATASYLQALQLKDATHELRLLTRNWSNVFTLAQASNYLIPYGNSTIIVTDQIFSIKDETYKVTFFLEKIARSIVRDQLQNFVIAFRSKLKGIDTQ